MSINFSFLYIGEVQALGCVEHEGQIYASSHGTRCNFMEVPTIWRNMCLKPFAAPFVFDMLLKKLTRQTSFHSRPLAAYKMESDKRHIVKSAKRYTRFVFGVSNPNT